MPSSITSLLQAVDNEARACQEFVAQEFGGDPVRAFAALTGLDREEAERVLAFAGLLPSAGEFVDDQGHRRTVLTVARDWSGRTGQPLDTDLAARAAERALEMAEDDDQVALTASDVEADLGRDFTHHRVL